MSYPPKISICLPVFNGAEYLVEAIESIQAQSFSDWNLIIVDDKSADASAQISQSFASADNRIIFKQNSVNLGHSRNYSEAISAANGEYVKLFSQDDILYPDALEKMVEVMDANPDVGLVCCAKRIISSHNGEQIVKRPFSGDKKIQGRQAIVFNLLKLTNWLGEPSLGMCRRSLILRNFDPTLYQFADCDFWFHILERSDFYYLDSVLCDYRLHHTNLSNKTHTSLAFACDVLRLGRKYQQLLQKFGDTDELFKARAVELISMEIDYLRREKGLTLENVLNTSVAGSMRIDKFDGEDYWQYINDLKELLFIYSEYVTDLLMKYDALLNRSNDEVSHLKQKVDNLVNSRTWKWSFPIRRIVQYFRSLY